MRRRLVHWGGTPRMRVRIASPWRHPDNGTYYFRQKIPVDLSPIIGRKIEKISLRTKDPAVARRLFLPHASAMQECWDDLRLRSPTMAAEQLQDAVAACRIAFVMRRRSAGQVAGRLDRSAWPEDGSALVPSFDPAADRDTHARDGKTDHGCVVPVTGTGIPPTSVVAVVLPVVPSHEISITMSFEIYASTFELAPSTVKRWRPVFNHLKLFAGHDDVRLLTRETLSAWRDDLLKSRSPVTVRDVYLASVKATLGWLCEEGRLTVNVAAAVKVRVAKQQLTRSKSLSDAEAKIILSAALLPHPGLGRPHAAARRWVPWICAYTGARVNEITQLRRRDVMKEGDIWFFRITPEAGSVKTKQFCHVPVHPDLIRQGFLEFACRNGSEEMFYSPKKVPLEDDPHPPYKKIAERLAAWVRGLGITDEGVSPSHGWRHRFKTEGRSAGVDSRILDAIQGHAAASEGDQYGEYPLELLMREMLKMPDYSVAGK
jgi:integrase